MLPQLQISEHEQVDRSFDKEVEVTTIAIYKEKVPLGQVREGCIVTSIYVSGLIASNETIKLSQDQLQHAGIGGCALRCLQHIAFRRSRKLWHASSLDAAISITQAT